jgi:hypothetical protein
MAGLTTVDRSSSVADVVAVLRRDGVVVVDRLVPADLIAQIRNELEPSLAAVRPGGGMWFGRQSKRISGVVALSPAFCSVITNETLVGVAAEVLKDNCANIQLQLSAALEVWPNGTLQPLHRDDGVYLPYLQLDGKQHLISFMLAGTDFTPANGSTRFVVGSHEWPVSREPRDEEAVQVEMVAGSVAIWLGSTAHGMSVNRTDEPRLGIVSGYSVGWLRQEENQYLTVPPDVAATLPDDVARILGYCAHTPILGWVGGRDGDLQTRPAKDDDQADYLAYVPT